MDSLCDRTLLACQASGYSHSELDRITSLMVAIHHSGYRPIGMTLQT